MYHGPLSFDYSTIKNKISVKEAAKKANKREKDLKEIDIDDSVMVFVRLRSIYVLVQVSNVIQIVI